MNEYKADLWAWFLRHAEEHNGFYWDKPDLYVITHLTECGIDLEKSDSPDVGTVSEFVSTVDDNDEIACITVSHWQCNCGEYGTTSHVKSRNWPTLAVRDVKLSDVIAGVINGT